MALNKIFNRINWQNRPSTTTALGASNLNKMDAALNEVDNRIVILDDTKADKSIINTLVKQVELDPSTGVLTVTQLDGTVTSYDLDIEKVVTNFNLNEQNQLVLTLAGGVEKVIDLSKFIDTYTFTDNAVMGFTNANKTISAFIKKGTLTEDYLNTALFQEIRQKALDAQIAAADSLLYSRDSKRYAIGGEMEGDEEDNAKYYKEQAEQFKTEAQAAADRAESVTNVSIATKTSPGIVKASTEINVELDGALTLGDISDKKVSITDTENHFTATKLDEVLNELYGKIDGIQLTDSKIDVTDTENHFTATKLDGVLNELFQSANNGKIAVATAIGSPATASDTFPVLAQKIDTQQAEYQTTINNVTGQRDSLQGNINTSLTHLKNMGCITDPLTADKVPIGILEANSKITNITNEKNTWYNNYTSMETDRNNWMNLANSKKDYWETKVRIVGVGMQNITLPFVPRVLYYTVDGTERNTWHTKTYGTAGGTTVANMVLNPTSLWSLIYQWSQTPTIATISRHDSFFLDDYTEFEIMIWA